MFDDLAAHFAENCLAAFHEYARMAAAKSAGNSKDLRLAINAASALYHFREHLLPSFPKTREQLVHQCPDYALLGDIVNASKHGILTRGSPQVVAAADIYEEQITTEYRDDLGPYWDTEKVVTVKCRDGSARDLYDVLVNVLNMWVVELNGLGVLPRLETLPPRITTLPSRQSASGAEHFDLEAVAGVRFRLRGRLQRYNYATGRAEPIDLAGSTIEFRLIRPPTVRLALRHEASGQEFSLEVELTAEEALVLKDIDAQEDRRAFVESCVRGRKVYQEFLEDAWEWERTVGRANEVGGTHD